MYEVARPPPSILHITWLVHHMTNIVCKIAFTARSLISALLCSFASILIAYYICNTYLTTIPQGRYWVAHKISVALRPRQQCPPVHSRLLLYCSAARDPVHWKISSGLRVPAILVTGLIRRCELLFVTYICRLVGREMPNFKLRFSNINFDLE